MYTKFRDEIFERGVVAEIDEYINRKLASFDLKTQREEYELFMAKIMFYRFPKSIREKLFNPELDDTAKEVIVLSYIDYIAEHPEANVM